MVVVQEVTEASSPNVEFKDKLPGKGDSSDEEYIDGDEYYTDEDEEHIQTGTINTGYRKNKNSNEIKTYTKPKYQFIPNWFRIKANRVWKRVLQLYSLTRGLSWICTTTLLLVGLPVLFAYDREKNAQDQHLMLPADTI